MREPAISTDSNGLARKLSAILGSAIFAVIAPGTIAGLVPWWLTHWRFEPPLLGFAAFRYLGAALILAGLPVLIDSFARFALQGLGTPAPIFPPRHLVVSGLYRYVRNPMYVSVGSIVLGEALLFGSVDTLTYAIAVWLGFFIFVLVYEEPTLRRTFGAEYDEFCANVPRWIPRFTPWHGPAAGAAESVAHE